MHENEAVTIYASQNTARGLNIYNIIFCLSNSHPKHILRPCTERIATPTVCRIGVYTLPSFDITKHTNHCNAFVYFQ